MTESLAAKVLIVDDDAMVRRATVRVLRREGYEVVESGSGEEALTMLEEAPPTVLLLDLVMPGMDGKQVLERLAPSPEDPYAVIVLSGQGDDEAIKACYAAGVTTFLRKPISPYELRGAVSNAVALKRHARGLDAIVADRTSELERKNRELLQAKEAAEAADRAKGAFLDQVGHELRTPVTAILGLAELVLDSPLDDEQRENLEILVDSSNQLVTLLNELLTVTRLERGRMTLKRAPFQLIPIFEEVERLYRPRAEEKGMVLALVCDAPSDGPWLGDGQRMEQILFNLVGNAIKFTDGGTVRVSAMVKPPTAPDVLSTLMVAVEDDGDGIPEEDRERIFLPFVQGDGSWTRRHGGTGLGLAVSRQLARLMGGDVLLESRVGNGSTFRVVVRCQRV